MINLANLQSLTQDKKKLALAALIVVIFLYIDVTFIMGFQLKSAIGSRAKIIKLKNDLGALKKELAKIEDLKKNNALDSQRPSLKAKKAITAEEIPSLIQMISDLANKNTVRIIQIKPSRQEVPVNNAKPVPAAPANLTPLLITLDLSGDYHHFGKFINQLEDAETLLVVEEMKIISDGKDYFQQKANLVLRAYVKK